MTNPEQPATINCDSDRFANELCACVVVFHIVIWTGANQPKYIDEKLSLLIPRSGVRPAVLLI